MILLFVVGLGLIYLIYGPGAAIFGFTCLLAGLLPIGIILLMGLVTKNAILLIDFVNQERAGGASRTQAVLAAGRIRLRPILMTTLAMIFGMIPLALGLGEGGEQRAPMGQAVIGGVITSSILTLVVVPVVYCYLDDLSGWLKRRWGGASAPSQDPPLKM